MEARNAFAIRTSETSAPDEVFARYFAPEVLDVLPRDLFARSSLVLRSSPGGGKTSLLRIFTPGPLRQVVRNRHLPPHDEIFRHLKDLGAVTADWAAAFGVLVPCGTGYSEIGSPLDLPVAKSLFRALINARIVLRSLRAVCVLNDLEYPNGLDRIACDYAPSLFDEGPIPRLESLSQLREWAEELESQCFARLDAVTGTDSAPPLHASFDAVIWLSQAAFRVGGQPMAARPIVMFDDVHRLRPWQRDMLYKELLDHRSGTPVWLAERTSVLDPLSVLTDAVPDRDYAEIRLEDVWPQRGRQYLKFVMSIADRRVALMKNELESFGDHLASELSPVEVDEEAVAAVAADCRKLANGTQLFDRWIEAANAFSGTPFERAVEWTRVGILMRRELGNHQATLELEPLPVEGVDPRGISGLAQAAERFVCTRCNVPYFYGIDRVVRLSSFNVEEFLQICAVLYEHIHAQRLMKRRGGPVLVSPRSQETAVRKLAEKRLADLPRQFTLGAHAKRLIDTIGEMCFERTYAPSAPYAPGVTGIGINTQDRRTLIDAAAAGPSAPYYELATVLSSCVAQNLFEARDNLRQDNKIWLVLYLNRLFCAHYNLAYHTGGWQRVSLRRLQDWIQGDRPRSGDKIRLV